MLGMDDGISDAESLYPCCPHCDNDDDCDGSHTAPCDFGCND